MDRFKYLVAAIVVAAMPIVYQLKTGVIHFRSFSAGDFAQQLTPLVLVALFIERSLEVFLTVWRGGKEATLGRDVEKATALADSDSTKLGKVHAANDALTNYRFATQQIALPSALIRGLGTLIDMNAPNNSAVLDYQRRWFNLVDVLLTGSLVGGGSDFMHKVITTFTDLMDATTQKAKATS